MINILLLGVAFAQEPNPSPETTDQPAEELEPLLKEPTLVEFIQAPYPEQAKAEGREGTVLLLIEIDESGAVSLVEVLNSAGEEFDQAAVKAAWGFVFTPAEDKDGPLPVQIEFEYGFVLDSKTVEGAVEDEQASEEIEYPINLDGTLKEMGTRRPLSEFPVTILLPDGTTQQTETDENGYYAFRGVPGGEVTITAVYPEYEKSQRKIEVVAEQVTTLTLWIKNLNYRENELVGIYRKPSADVSRRSISMEEVRRIPGTFGDPVRVVQNLPGAARSPFGSGVLIIRGANPQDSGVYVDGIRIPLIYHLGGYVSVLNSELIETVEYLPGSYGVQYGRTLGGVIDVKSKSDFPDEMKVNWSTDLIDSGGMFSGKVGKYDVAFAGRHSYIDRLIPYFTGDSGFTVSPRWYDYQFKVIRNTNNLGRFSAFLFGFNDKLLVSSPEDTANGTDPDAQGDIETTYSSHRLNLLWEKDFSKNWTFRLLPSIGIDHTYFDVGGGFKVDNLQTLFEMRGETSIKANDSFTFTAGIDWIIGAYDFQVELPFSFDYAANFDPLAEREPVFFGGEGLGVGPDVYVNAELRPLKDKEKWIIYPGLRFNYASLKDQAVDEPSFVGHSWDPRLSTRYKMFTNTTIKSGIGIYTQPPQPFELWRPDGSTELLFEESYSAELGVEQIFSNAIQGDVSIFGKYLNKMIVNNPDATSADDLFYVNEGVGRIYGMELILRHAPVGRFFGWISYTLSRSERNDYPDREIEVGEDDLANSPSTGGWYVFDLDQTHILVMVGGFQFPGDLGISSKLQYVTGNPYTPYAGGVYDIDQDSYFAFPSGDYNKERLPPFFSVDVRVDKLFTFKNWQLETYVDMLNVLRGINPEFTLYNYDYTESTYIRGLPFIPSLGFEADFYF